MTYGNGNVEEGIWANDKLVNPMPIESAGTTTSLQVASVAGDGELRGWYRRQYAIVVGIDRYKNQEIDVLKNAENDAKAIAQMFREIGFEVIELYGDNATRQNIIDRIGQIQKQVQKDDSFLFYFAGHGQGVTLESKSKEGYIIPYDSMTNLEQPDLIQYDEESLSLQRLRNYMMNMKAKHVAMLLDSCFAGLAMKRGVAEMVKPDLEYYNDILSRKAMDILTAGDDEPVSDGSGHSPFTQALLNGLGKRGVDINGRNGYCTFKQLAVYVKEKVERATGRRQRPQFDNLSQEDGDFIFKLK